ncbi:LOW QUALITY PROTEIN: hypothetical protein SORBI_3006G273150 [Sorghum bicolor]|uniref:Uncharacterized protein n=1 Tax=Sorghum bicolor TaxID=4558 RepID=A0A1Z5RFR9_SORBI|nr:LOW QUALITY PROTEIN: hypothetical protein SORBI_3006G273150 [Sorghum bicolor]
MAFPSPMSMGLRPTTTVALRCASSTVVAKESLDSTAPRRPAACYSYIHSTYGTAAGRHARRVSDEMPAGGRGPGQPPNRPPCLARARARPATLPAEQSTQLLHPPAERPNVSVQCWVRSVSCLLPDKAVPFWLACRAGQASCPPLCHHSARAVGISVSSSGRGKHHPFHEYELHRVRGAG